MDRDACSENNGFMNCCSSKMQLPRKTSFFHTGRWSVLRDILRKITTNNFSFSFGMNQVGIKEVPKPHEPSIKSTMETEENLPQFISGLSTLQLMFH